jgi:hypothetical protein
MEIDPAYIVGLVITLLGISLAFRESPLSQITEYLAVGIGGGNSAVRAIKYVYERGYLAIVEKNQILPIYMIIIASLLYLSLYRPWRHLSRWPVAISAGVNLGLPVALVETQIIRQLLSTTQGFMTPNPQEIINAIIIAVAMITVLWFFIFSRKGVGVTGYMQQAGRLFLMLYFGLQVGNITMGNTSRIVDRILFLFGQA